MEVGQWFFQAEDGIRDVERSRGLGDVYKRQEWALYKQEYRKQYSTATEETERQDQLFLLRFIEVRKL